MKWQWFGNRLVEGIIIGIAWSLASGYVNGIGLPWWAAFLVGSFVVGVIAWLVTKKVNVFGVD
jgi:hypothetical protein